MYKSVFKKFSYLEGSQHIASENALREIEKLANKKHIKTVFEFGIGIGTIPYLLFNLDQEINYIGTESNDFCIKALNKNLKNIKTNKSFLHLNNHSMYDGEEVDLIIIDGNFNDESFLKKICHKNTIILIEGKRSKQVEFILKIFPKALASHKISNKKNMIYSPFYKKYQNPYIGGFSLIRINNSPKNIVKTYIEKIVTSIKYK